VSRIRQWPPFYRHSSNHPAGESREGSNSVLCQTFGQILEWRIGIIRFVPVARSAAMNQHDGRERPFPFRDDRKVFLIRVFMVASRSRA
jgi:hypothetical protein